MSDDRTPGDKFGDALERWIIAGFEALEHRIIAEVGSAIHREGEAIRAELRLQGERTRDDLAVAMGSMDHIERRMENDRQDMKQVRETISMLHRRLRDLEHHIHHGGPKPPEPA